MLLRFSSVSMVLGGLLLAHASDPDALVRLEATFGKSDLRSMTRQAQAVAVLLPTGVAADHWNSADNRRWGDVGTDSFIYRDIEVRVERVLGGDIEGDIITVRVLGGTSDNVTMLFDEGGQELQQGGPYLVFLRRADFPTKEGTERMWTPVRLSQGVFVLDGGTWFERIQGFRVHEEDVGGLMSGALTPP